ncbi:hypothetical protein ACHAW6_012848 [Cyclotella cf. meneghiniana]
MSGSPRRSHAWLEPSDPHSPEAPTNNDRRELDASFHIDEHAPNGQDQFLHQSAAGFASRFDSLQRQHQAEQQRQHWGTAAARSSAYSNALRNQSLNIGMYPTMGMTYLLNNNPAPAPVVHASSVPYVMATASGCAAIPSSHQFMHYAYSPYSLYQMQPLSTLQLPTQSLLDVSVAEQESTLDDEDAFKLLFMEKFQQKLSTRFTSDEPAASQQTGDSAQQTSMSWGQVMDNYLEQRQTLVENTRQLLDAQIAHQRSILQRQYDFSRQNESWHDHRDAAERRDSEQAGALKPSGTTEIASNSQNSTRESPREPIDARVTPKNHKTSPAQALFSPLKKCVVGQITNSVSTEGTSRDTRPSLPIEKSPAVSVAINPVTQPKMPQVASESNKTKRKRGPYKKKANSKLAASPSSVPLESLMPCFPKNYEKFIQEIALDVRAENIIDKFNEWMDPETDRILLSAVKEDNEHIQEEREARQLFYNEQLETMNKRLEMYSKLEKAIELINIENGRSHQPKNARSLFKTHIREVTMDLVHIGLSNYQMLEDNMDSILGIKNN